MMGDGVVVGFGGLFEVSGGVGDEFDLLYDEVLWIVIEMCCVLIFGV